MPTITPQRRHAPVLFMSGREAITIRVSERMINNLSEIAKRRNTTVGATLMEALQIGFSQLCRDNEVAI